MRILAGILGAVFGAVHLFGSPSPAAPPAERGSGDPGAIPPWTRVAWRASAVVTLLGAVAVGLSGSVVAVAVLGAGMFIVADLALLNGYWMHGRPQVSHHVVRYGLGAIIMAVAVLGT